MIIRQKGDVIELKGSLDANQWLALKSVVSLLLKQHPSGVVIDGSGLTDISEAGAFMFIEAAEYIQSLNARVFLAALSDEILEEIRKVPGIRSQLPLASSIEEARASLAVGDSDAVYDAVRKPAVLVPLLGAWRNAVDYAATHAGKKAEIHLLYVIEVPRSQPLGVPLPEQEHAATEALSEAERMLKRRGITTRRMITRARIGIEGAGKFAADTRPRLVIAAYAKDNLQMDTEGQDVIATLAGEARGDVAVYIVNAPSERAGESKLPCKPVILVPLIGAWVNAVEFAMAQASAAKKEIHLLYVIQVPRVQPLDVETPEKDREADETLAEAERMLRRSGITVSKSTTRARDIMEGAGRFAADTRPELVTVAYYREDLIERGARFSVVTTLCHEAPCDVLLFCAAPE